MNADPFFEKKKRLLVKYKYNGSEDKAKRDIEKLEGGEPLEYLLGWTVFCGNKIDVSLRTFRPRQGSQPWVQDAIREIKEKNTHPVQCLDPYAGSGCIGLAVLTHIPESEVDFVDIDQRALEQTEINLKLHRIPRSRYSLIHADNLNNLPRDSYDYILANPPYIPSMRQEEVMPYVLAHEPHIAFLAGEDGLLCIRPLISQAQNILKPGGKIWIETGQWHEKSGLENLLKNEDYAQIFWGNEHISISAEKPL